MKLLTVAICDDEKNIAMTLAGALEKIFEQYDTRIETEMFSSVDAFARRLREKHFDTVFLDIDMPGTDGISFGKKLREENEDIDIVYVSGREDRVFEAFAAHPFGFIRKGNFLQDSTDLIPQLIASRTGEKNETLVDIRSNTSIISIKVSELIYVESIKDYQYFYFENKTEPIRLRSTMDKLEAQLGQYGFIRIHKGYIVGYAHIRRIDDDSITLVDGRTLPVSRRKLTEVRAKYLEFGSSLGKNMIR